MSLNGDDDDDAVAADGDGDVAMLNDDSCVEVVVVLIRLLSLFY